MEIKIGNVLAGFLLIFCLGAYVKMKPEILAVVSAVMKIGPGNTPEDQLHGIIALGLIILGLLGALRLIISERQK